MEEVQRNELLDRAEFGRQVELFWSSRVGGYLQERARELYSTALSQLKSCDPTDTKLVMRLQNEVWKAENFELWLSQAVTDGLKSLEILESGDADE